MTWAKQWLGKALAVQFFVTCAHFDTCARKCIVFSGFCYLFGETLVPACEFQVENCVLNVLHAVNRSKSGKPATFKTVYVRLRSCTGRRHRFYGWAEVETSL